MKADESRLFLFVFIPRLICNQESKCCILKNKQGFPLLFVTLLFLIIIKLIVSFPIISYERFAFSQLFL